MKSQEDLMLWVMKEFSEKFKSKAILRGGMALRLFSSSRYTNDLDYSFVPYKSKKDLVEPISDVLKQLEELVFSYSLNSKCLRFKLNYQGILLQIEVTASEECKSISVDTTALTQRSMFPSFVLRVMDFRVALSNKIAAWNERRIIRDLYDIYYITTFIETSPDLEVLSKRLAKVKHGHRVANKKSKMTLDELLGELEVEVRRLSEEEVSEVLRDYLNAEELVGLPMKIKVSVLKLCERLRLDS